MEHPPSGGAIGELNTPDRTNAPNVAPTLGSSRVPSLFIVKVWPVIILEVAGVNEMTFPLIV